MLLFTLTSLLLIVEASGVSQSKSASDVTIYAYGTNISGLPVLADSSGIAHVSLAPSNLPEVSWSITTGGTVPWNVTANSTAENPATPSTVYIITTADAFAPVGFLSSNGTAPTGAETVGFTLYGSVVSFISGSALMSQFWATPANVPGAWQIVWNVNSTKHEGSFPVTLKTTSPNV